MTDKLPDWATVGNDGVILFHPSEAYEEAARALGWTKWDQAKLEIARRCVTLRLKNTIKASLTLMNLVGETGLRLRIAREPEYALRNHPAGKGAEWGASNEALNLHYQPYLNGLKSLEGAGA